MADNLSEQLASLRIDRSGGGPSKGGGRKSDSGDSKLTSYLGVAVGVLVAVVAGWWGYHAATDRLLKVVVSTGEITIISPAQADVKLMATGYLVPQRKAVVASKLPGR